ncbi:PTS fructose transporter subunit IIC [Vibrio gazogenes]|uniref:protein-N(pi)-phosphohistidine--D-fructose phosphotransferase n=2 Tax=Vibrio gazogenes TaxID=687 RepID=A0A1M4YWN1_VIBGA|nr:PTS fructose transporter subunit IIBC [Vibrio gazogenes]USP15125.1 PTS fructose transporter subunit IIBC [Vibrio gazogenes]SHF10140.1 PTS system, mannose-specific IIC component [Vibrio gazogenes DSM 21264] [Vibrio gazogenes DSM 21264 = NBRC 103151]SJN58369.1 PTS system fructose-specific EIIBC component [Vibrio gazogenes]
MMKVVAITSCAAGISHTFMAEEALIEAGQQNGYDIRVETQGNIGTQTPLTESEISAAELVIIASDVTIPLTRFVGKRVYQVSTNDAIANAAQVIEDAKTKAETIASDVIQSAKGTSVGGGVTIGSSSHNAFFRHTMSGVGYMIPMATCGLLLALANIFAFNSDAQGHLVNWGFDETTALGYFMSHLFMVGKVGFTLMIPLFAGFVANSIADRPAIAPAMIGAYIANDPTFLGTKTGGSFLAALLIAFIVGYFVLYLKRVPWPKILRPAVPIMIIPVISTFFIFIFVLYGIGKPISLAMDTMYHGLNVLITEHKGSSFLIGAVIGGMIGFDFGGPINKTAYVFSTAVFVDTLGQYGVEGANLLPFTAVQAAISIAPLGVFVASRLFKKKFNAEEKNTANAACAMGLVGVSEGAIPFAAAHPLQVIVASVCGSALAGGLVGLWGIKNFGGLGSPLGTVIGYIEQPIPVVSWLLCTGAGILLTAVIIGVWRPKVPTAESPMAE